MRVALVYQSFGLATSLERDRVLLARALVAEGVDVHCYGNVDERTADVPGATFHNVGPRVSSPRSRLGHPVEYGRFALAATQTLRRERARYDLVDVSGTTAWEHDVVRVHAVQEAEQRRWPTRGGRTFRGARARAFLAPVLHPKLGLARGIERLQFRPGRFRLALAVSDEVARDLEEVHRVPPGKIEVIPYAVDLERLRAPADAALRSRLGLGADDSIALFVGHDFDRKGLGEAIDALAAAEPPVHLAVVGDGVREPYARAADRLGVAARVHFLGATDAPEELYHDADLFLAPTREDVWGIGIIEAMAAGVPVVTTSVAGAASAVSAAGAGLVVEPGSTNALAEAIAAVVRDPARRREMAERGRATATAFDVRAIGRAVLTAYERLLAGTA